MARNEKKQESESESEESEHTKDNESSDTENESEEEEEAKIRSVPIMRSITIPGLKLTKTETKDGSTYLGKGTIILKYVCILLYSPIPKLFPLY